ncbi:hypothetical protein P7C70_g6481, partial [Phenoliferia sp. Uapishka_3]
MDALIKRMEAAAGMDEATGGDQASEEGEMFPWEDEEVSTDVGEYSDDDEEAADERKMLKRKLQWELKHSNAKGKEKARSVPATAKQLLDREAGRVRRAKEKVEQEKWMTSELADTAIASVAACGKDKKGVRKRSRCMKNSHWKLNRDFQMYCKKTGAAGMLLISFTEYTPTNDSDYVVASANLRGKASNDLTALGKTINGQWRDALVTHRQAQVSDKARLISDSNSIQRKYNASKKEGKKLAGENTRLAEENAALSRRLAAMDAGANAALAGMEGSE